MAYWGSPSSDSAVRIVVEPGACHPVAFMSSAKVTPSGRFSRSSTFAALLPSRATLAFFAPLGAFMGALAFLADLALLGATRARFGPTLAFWVGFAFSAAG